MMNMVSKFFNTAGPMQADIHYCVDPLTRVNLDEIMMLIKQRKYFILHAPRQTGKTSCLLALRDYINAGTDYYAVYANIEAGQALRNQVAEVNNAILSSIALRAEEVMNNNLTEKIATEVLSSDVQTPITQFLTRWCLSLDRPLILMLDEIDALVGDS
ncbi:MAG: ATP-binding protein, partial [Bacteroides sp.]